jgi:hypothetical protein
VQDLYVWHELQRRSPDEIVASFPQLTLAQVHGALAYYYDHRELIESEVASERAASPAPKGTALPSLSNPVVGADGDAAPIPTR